MKLATKKFFTIEELEALRLAVLAHGKKQELKQEALPVIQTCPTIRLVADNMRKHVNSNEK